MKSESQLDTNVHAVIQHSGYTEDRPVPVARTGEGSEEPPRSNKRVVVNRNKPIISKDADKDQLSQNVDSILNQSLSSAFFSSLKGKEGNSSIEAAKVSLVYKRGLILLLSQRNINRKLKS